MLLRILLTVSALTALAASALDDTQKAAYKAVSAKELRMDAEGHKNDKVAVAGFYIGFAANFYPYMESSGFEPDRYVAFSVDTPAVPVMMRKKDEHMTVLLALKPGAQVTVYGRVKEFRTAPTDTRLPKYYIEFDAVEAAMPAVGIGNAGPHKPAGAAPAPGGAGAEAPAKVPPRERFQKRRDP